MEDKGEGGEGGEGNEGRIWEEFGDDELEGGGGGEVEWLGKSVKWEDDGGFGLLYGLVVFLEEGGFGELGL